MQYQIREEQKDFILRGKIISDTTVVVTFLTDTLAHFYQILQNFQKNVQLVYENDILIGYEVYYAKISKSELYHRFQTKDEIDIDECFIDDISLVEYLQFSGYDIENIHNQQYHFPKKISAKRAFFLNVNFSGLKATHFEGFFHGTFFAGKIAEFSSMNITRGFFDFTRAFVNTNVDFDFSFTKIEYGDLLFNYTYFDVGYRQFVSLFLNRGDLYFTGAFFMGGVIDFSYVIAKGRLICNRIYSKGSHLSMNQAEISGLTMTLAEFRDSSITMAYSQIGNDLKNFKEMFLENTTASFEQTHFGEGVIDFSYLESKNSSVRFCNTYFDSENFDFSYARVSGLVSFTGAYLNDMSMSFADSVLDTVTFDSCKSNNSINFRVQQCHALSLKNTLIGDVFDIGHLAKFQYLQLASLMLPGRLVISWKENNVLSAISNVFVEEFNRMKSLVRPEIYIKKAKEIKLTQAEIFRTLKDNFKNINRYADEDITYVTYRRFLRKYNIFNEGLGKRVSGFFEWFVLDLLGGYGTDPWRALFAIVFTWVSFSGIYYGLDSFHISEFSQGMTRVERSLYHSAITLFTIGYGDLIPKGFLMRLLSMLEGFFGVLLPSYFMIAFTRKVLR